MTHFDVVVLGAGAAGMYCAMRAGQRGRRVLLIDHAEEAGKKILISGGGRCNFTNTGCVPERFLSANPHFARSALSRHTQHDFIALVQKHRIAFHEKTLGQLFCDGPARQVVAMLLAECGAAGVELRLGTRVTGITRADRFNISTDRGGVTAESLVLATGGLSIPKMGATGFAHDVARRFGLPLVAPRPGLVPLMFAGEDLELMRPLAGVALPTVARCGRGTFAEAMLFTHRGLSGPAILQASSYWREGEPILLDLLPGRDATAELLAAKRARPKAESRTILSEMLPQRLAQVMAETQLPPRIMGEVGDAPLKALGTLLKGWQLMPAGTEGYAKAEVTLGGVATDALSQQTMAAKAVPGLFVIGEAVDVTGWLGGYNFQWAWSSGWAAGEAA
ncbi:NAD(P)/FAD-dependent oxidoreductase [Roseomonas sp. PWR1]|uniref:NAD(P)/FAD-dependent oxidoreductase n=1 Tax=Roseomonas nitratireducens TaxID=2820810 RepID=A0ABS4AYR4_9PROT|nr:NAD(P)/FAD-dependent oxidoreductase [Neoroseomonas nitratireducens]MBP0466520.1 NAD(P)/FAD-dependent oxidoreductase [Neoroseomonas nitratireducens]